MPEIAVSVVPDVVQVAVEVPGEVNVYTGAGSIGLTGTAEVTRTQVHQPSGGIGLSGSAEVTRGYVHDPTGGVSLIGSAAASYQAAGGTNNFQHQGSGSISIFGAATVSWQSGPTTIGGGIGDPVEYTHQASGSVLLSGAAVSTFQSGATGITAIGDNVAYEHTPSGGVALSGEAVVDLLPAITIITEEIPPAALGYHYTFQLGASVPVPDAEWSLLSGTLPAGFTFNLAGILDGNPSALTSSAVYLVFEVNAPGYAPAQKILSMVVGAAPFSEEFQMLAFTMPSGFVGVSYLLQLNVSGNVGPVVLEISEGGLPTGMDITENGLIYGAAIVGGYYPFTVKATDTGTGDSISVSTSLFIGSHSQIQILTQADLPSAVVGQSYPGVQFLVAGNTGPVTWDVITPVPPGFNLSPSGFFDGLPTQPGNFTFTARVAHSPDLSATLTFSLQVLSVSHYNHTPTGSIGIAGSGNASRGFNHVPSGGVSLLGSAQVVFTPNAGPNAYTYSPQGVSLSLGGTAQASYTPNPANISAQITLANDVVITVSPGDNYVYTTGLTAGSIVAPRGCPGIQIYMIVDGTFIFFGIRNTGRNYGGTPYGGVPQPVYVKDVIANMPGRLVPYGQLFRSVRQNGSLFTLIHHDDPKHPMFAQANDPIAYGSKATSTTPATGSHAYHLLNGGMEMQWVWVLDSDPIEQSREPTSAMIDDALELLGIDTDMIANYPNCLHTVDNFERVPSQDNSPNLPRPQTKEGWLMFPENVAYLGGGAAAFQGTGAEKMKCWHHGQSVFTIGTKINTNGHYWEPAWWILNYLRHPTTKYECLAIALGINRQEIACGMFRCDVTYAVKDWYIPEGTNLLAMNPSTPSNHPEEDPDAVLYCRGTDTGWAYPSLAKQYDLSRVLVKILRPDDMVNNDCFSRRSNFWLNFNVNTNFGVNNSNKLISDGQRVVAHVLYNMMWFYRYYKLVAGDLTTANLIKAKANQLIENLYQLTQAAVPVNPKPKWLPRTNNPTVTPWAGIEVFGMSGVGEGVYHAMAKWIFDEGTNATRQVWFKELVEWALQNLLEYVTATRVRFAYTWQPDTSGPANWNNPPQIHTGTEQNAHILQLLPFILEWWPGVVWTVPGFPGGLTTETLCQYLINDIWNGAYTAANTGAISTGPNNFSSTPKFNRIKAHSVVLKKGL